MKQSLEYLPALLALSGLVSDPTLSLGPLPSISRNSTTHETAAVPMLQAMLFDDVKIWPVSLPNPTRLRWAYIIRMLKHCLSCTTLSDDDGPLMEQAASIRDEV